MTEYFTESFVIDKKANGESDAMVVLYTQNLGRVMAKAKSIKKITSKLNGHLEPLNFVECRLIEKNGFQIVDTLTLNNNSHLRKDEFIYRQSLKLLQFVEAMTFDLQPDVRFYAAIKKIFEHFVDYKDKQKIIYFHLLKILGFDPKFALCAGCHSDNIVYFQIVDNVFLCEKCSLPPHQTRIGAEGAKNNKSALWCGGLKISEGELILIK